MHREDRIRTRTEDQQVVHLTPISQVHTFCLHSQRPKPINLLHLLSILRISISVIPVLYLLQVGLEAEHQAPTIGVPWLLIMGCISSKVTARSISFHEERKQGSRRAANGIPLLEDLIISANGSDQYLALVRAANTVSNRLPSRSLSSNTFSKLAIEPVSSETIDKLEISTKIDQEVGKQIESNKNKRSKSWHAFPEHIVSSLGQENLSGFEDKHNLSSKGAVGSRSFHTVEEYDDMVNRIWVSKSGQESELNDDDDGSGIIKDLRVFEFVSNAAHHTEDKDSTAKQMQPPCLHNQCLLEESKIVKEISIPSTAPESTIVIPSPNTHISCSGKKNEEASPSQKPNMLEIANSVQRASSTIEKGNKRKALAKRLESLRIPSNIELPAIASLREWVPASGIYSPGNYVTPKFGSYSVMNIRNGNESSEDSIFSPELVSAIEQCMQKLEADEESILKQITENVEEESDRGMQPKERTPPSIQD